MIESNYAALQDSRIRGWKIIIYIETSKTIFQNIGMTKFLQNIMMTAAQWVAFLLPRLGFVDWDAEQ